MKTCGKCKGDGYVCCGCPDEQASGDGPYALHCCGERDPCPECDTFGVVPEQNRERTL